MTCQIPEIYISSLPDEAGNRYSFEGQMYKSLEDIKISTSTPYVCLIGGGGWVFLVVEDGKAVGGYDSETQKDVNEEVGDYQAAGFPEDWKSATLERWRRQRKERRHRDVMRRR